jgi:aminomethyltransferase
VPLLQTPLTAWHKAHGAKTAPFAGWEMPIQYEGILAEHKHTRSEASLFDICHMGEFLLQGPSVTEALSKVVSHNLDTLAPGRCRYGFLLNPQGGVQDDLIVYRLEEDKYMLVVNGACTASDFQWIRERLPASIPMEDISERTAKIDLQGPKSLQALESVLNEDFHGLKYFGLTHTSFEGQPLLVSRTGYTGELGYELYIDTSKVVSLWEQLLACPEVKPAGLGARDTLRLEVGLPLYGQDMDTTHTPTEAGYGAMLTSSAAYSGKGPDREVREKLIGLTIPGRRSARHGDALLLPSGEEVGVVTSGSYAPSLEQAVALAYVPKDHADQKKFLVKGARTTLEAQQTEPLFYRDGTARVKL